MKPNVIMKNFIMTNDKTVLKYKSRYGKIYKIDKDTYAIHRLTSEKDKDTFYEMLKEIGLENQYEKWYNLFKELLKKSFSLEGNIKINLPDKMKLFPYQIATIEYIELMNGKALLGDIMGTGKTISALGYLNLHPELRPVLIVCPLSVVEHWKKHIEKWIVENKSICIVNRDICDADFYIINWDKLHLRMDLLSSIPFQCVIGDEAHKMKNPKAKRTKAFISLAKNRKSILLLTGTPLHNKPIDLYPLANLLNPYDFPNWLYFAKKYCNAYQRKMGRNKFWVVDGRSNTKELFERLRTTMLKRAKTEELMKQLPEYNRVLIPIKETKDVADLNKQIIEEAKQLKSIKVSFIGLIEKFFMKAIETKMEKCLDFLENALEEEDKIVVFAHHRNVIERICSFLNEKGIEGSSITGDMPLKKRIEELNKFQNGSARVFVASIEACGEGVSLTKARMALFFELRWNLETLRQAEMRLLRHGQMRKCMYYYFVVDNTIEVNIVKMLNKKFENVNQIIEGKFDKEITLFDIILHPLT